MSAWPVLVGRDAELVAFDEVVADGPGLIVIEGDAGVGKSRLLAELVRRHPALVGAAPPYSEPYTLAPLVDALKGVRAEKLRQLSPLAGALRPLFPEWSDGLPMALEPAGDHLAERHRLFRALAELVAVVEVPVLAIEDAHWADDATLEFLLYLAAQRPLPVSIVLTLRREKCDTGSLLGKIISRAPAGGTLLRIALEPLDIVGTRQLAAQLLDGEPVSDEFARFLHPAPTACRWL